MCEESLQNTIYIIVFILNRNSKHVAHVERKTGKKNKIKSAAASIKVPYTIYTCTSISELPSNIEPGKAPAQAHSMVAIKSIKF